MTTLTQLAIDGSFDLELYRQAQCAEGYTGPLCALCEPGYGRLRSLTECTRCPPKRENDGAQTSQVLCDESEFKRR